MPRITRVLETALYVDDLDVNVAFYRDVMGFSVLDAGDRLVAMSRSGTVVLLFKRGATTIGANTPGGWIPPHDGQGPVQLAFAVATEDLPEWEAHLRLHGIEIESHVQWPRGGRSVYFRDPAGHSLELATPGTWATY